jgi:hypothetical protein
MNGSTFTNTILENGVFPLDPDLFVGKQKINSNDWKKHASLS